MSFFKSFKKLLGKGLFSPFKLLLLVLPMMVFFSSSLKPLEGENKIIAVFQNIIYPIQYVFHKTGSTLEKTYTSYFDSLAIANKNEELEEKVLKLEAELLTYNELKNEISQLKGMADFSKNFDFKKLEVARVIGGPNHLLSSGLRVSLGTSQGVKPGMPVLSSSGLVGKVLRSSYGFSDIQLVSDDNFVLDVFIERTRIRSLLRGGTRGKSYLSMGRDVDIRIGDKIISSGMLDIFPRGLSVGEVVTIRYDSREEYQIVEVRSEVERKSLEKVVVLKNLSHDQTSLEQIKQKKTPL